MSFKDIRGQDKAVLFLKNSIANNRVAHAYIFLGPSGVGKKYSALNFAKALNCQAEEAERPCDQCVFCRKIDSGIHPDVFLVAPEKEGASTGIDRVREVIRSIGLKPYEARYKVYIIDDAGSMTADAENALLKTLEEPPPESVLILIAESAQDLFSTIISRSQVVRFSALTIDEVKGILTEVYKVDEPRAHILARLFSGSLGEALKHKDANFFEKRSRIIDGLLNKTLFDSDFEGISRQELKLYLDIMLTWYRDMLIAKTGFAQRSALVNVDKEDLISSQAKSRDFGYIDSVIRQIILTTSFLDQNANQKLAMNVLGVKIF